MSSPRTRIAVAAAAALARARALNPTEPEINDLAHELGITH